ncbi:ribonuclease MC-like [Benincasa hispida]|uniref:ribonuclease MC-like n=1 Tax=Benincasa hispida TaxID=102211 RepID=UPI0018FFE536|nr:ribonuclease MC-like [Benincasa hispida]
MAKALLVISIFSLALLVFSVKAQYDYFQMVQQWPPATCSGVGVRCRAQPPSMFTIHGLWPSNYSTAHLVCTGLPFDPTQIAAIRPQLNTYWPDVIRGNNQRFWQHEWDAHGTCSDPPFNQRQYFQTTLNIRMNHNYDLLAILNAAGLGPTATMVRQYQAIENAIQAATGKIPGLRCNTNAQTGSRQLFEIILCFDKNGVTLIDCTPFAGITCPLQFVWLHRQPWSLGVVVEELKDSLVYEGSIPKFLFLSTIPLSIAFVFWKKFYQTTRGVRGGGKQE